MPDGPVDREEGDLAELSELVAEFDADGILDLIAALKEEVAVLEDEEVLSGAEEDELAAKLDEIDEQLARLEDAVESGQGQ